WYGGGGVEPGGGGKLGGDPCRRQRLAPPRSHYTQRGRVHTGRPGQPQRYAYRWGAGALLRPARWRHDSVRAEPVLLRAHPGGSRARTGRTVMSGLTVRFWGTRG